MQTATMAKELVFKMRLDDADRERLNALADHYSAPAATVVRILIKEKFDELGLGLDSELKALDRQLRRVGGTTPVHEAVMKVLRGAGERGVTGGTLVEAMRILGFDDAKDVIKAVDDLCTARVIKRRADNAYTAVEAQKSRSLRSHSKIARVARPSKASAKRGGAGG